MSAKSLSQRIKKQIKFNDCVKKHGHPKSDYKKDGTLKKNRQEPRDYYVDEIVSVNCEDLSIDGKHIGYVRPDMEDWWRDIDGGIGHKHPVVYNDDGECVKYCYTSISSWRTHYWGFGVFEGRNGKWVMDRPIGYNGYFFPLWICDKNDEPLYIIKKNYDYAKSVYAYDKFFNQGGYASKGVEDYEAEFDERFGGSVIDIDCTTYREYYYLSE